MLLVTVSLKIHENKILFFIRQMNGRKIKEVNECMLCLDMYVLHVNTSVCYVLTCTSCEHKSMLNSTGYFKICKNEGRGEAAPSMHEVLESTKQTQGSFECLMITK